MSTQVHWAFGPTLARVSPVDVTRRSCQPHDAAAAASHPAGEGIPEYAARASRIRSATSSRVAPRATTPGRIGQIGAPPAILPLLIDHRRTRSPQMLQSARASDATEHPRGTGSLRKACPATPTTHSVQSQNDGRSGAGSALTDEPPTRLLERSANFTIVLRQHRDPTSVLVRDARSWRFESTRVHCAESTPVGGGQTELCSRFCFSSLALVSVVCAPTPTQPAKHKRGRGGADAPVILDHALGFSAQFVAGFPAGVPLPSAPLGIS